MAQSFVDGNGHFSQKHCNHTIMVSNKGEEKVERKRRKKGKRKRKSERV